MDITWQQATVRNAKIFTGPRYSKDFIIWSEVGHQGEACPGFCSMKQLGIFLLLPGWDASPSQGYPSIKFCGTHLYTWAERGYVQIFYYFFPSGHDNESYNLIGS